MLESLEITAILARLPGYSGEDCDAQSAYTQVALEGHDIWVELPKEAQPKDGSWNRCIRPFCKLRLALYGHPLAGLCWEHHCKQALLKYGFTPV